MKLYEYEAKGVVSRYGIPVPRGNIATTADGAEEISRKLGDVVIKAQVLVGGRGKAGGIARAKDTEEVKENAQRILGMSIKGLPVKKLLVEEYKESQKEMYLGITIDRRARCPLIIASPQGGVDIEEIAKHAPRKIVRMRINPLIGVHDYQARAIASALDKKNAQEIAEIIKELYNVFVENDCTLAEINPLALSQGIFALDAKIIIDDSSLFRQNFKEDGTGSLEELAKKSGMSYVGLDGDIGCIVNGAGLAMATLDMIKANNGKPANFMDVRAGANAEQIKIAIRIISSNRKVKALLINIFGGLTRCDEVARGIIEAKIKVPLVIRLAGTNEEEGRRMLEKHGITFASSTEEAAAEVVKIGYPGI